MNGLASRLVSWLGCGALAVAFAPVDAAPTDERPVARALPDPIRLLDVPSYENTVAVAPPSPGVPRGAVVVVTGGYARGKRILVRPLLDAAGLWDGKSRTREVEFPTSSTFAVATDNQVVRLADGALLVEKDTWVWSDLRPAPPWKDELVSGGTGRHRLQRGIPVFFRSRDAGATWAVASFLDLAVLCEGRYGVPRPLAPGRGADVPVSQQGIDEQGKRYWWVGGADRTEVYACPFTGIVWCTTRVISGPYGTAFPQRNTTLLARSVDDGRTWEVVKEDLPAWSPTVMTSTPDGRLFLLQAIGDSPVLWWSAEPTAKDKAVAVVGGKPTHYVEDGKPVPEGGDVGVDLESKLFAPSLARLGAGDGESRVRVAYPGLNRAGRQTACVVDVAVRGSTGEARLSNVVRIEAARPLSASVMYFTFVEPGADSADAARRSLHLLYWIEAPAKDAAEKAYSARFALFDAQGIVGTPQPLSLREGRAHEWTTRQDPGDYLDGAYFEVRGRASFLCPWPEPDGLWANVVQVGTGDASPGTPAK